MEMFPNLQLLPQQAQLGSAAMTWSNHGCSILSLLRYHLAWFIVIQPMRSERNSRKFLFFLGGHMLLFIILFKLCMLLQYVTKLIELQDELSALHTILDCLCGAFKRSQILNQYQHYQHIMKFLMVLNDSYIWPNTRLNFTNGSSSLSQPGLCTHPPRKMSAQHLTRRSTS